MSRPIIAALRQQKQLRGNTFHVATELAHRLNPSGYGRVSYQFLAWKSHCCLRTAITQVKNLIAEGLFRKTVIRTREGYAWNLYQYCGPKPKTAFPPVTTHSGPAGAFAQKYTVMHNALSDNKLYGHRKVSQYHRVVSYCTLK
jgi:hypothetical protein